MGGTWRSSGDERKTYSDQITSIITGWRKKKLEFSGQEADKIKLRLGQFNVLITDSLWDKLLHWRV